MKFIFKGETSMMLLLEHPIRLSTDIDIVFMESPDEHVLLKPIKNELLATDSEDRMVVVPTPECLPGDKLAAFAPYTTGVLLGKAKELKIAKQFFDVVTLAEQMQDQRQFQTTYNKAVLEELAFRGLNLRKEDVLKDTIRACISIISRGEYDKDDYVEYLKGIRSLSEHIPGYQAGVYLPGIRGSFRLLLSQHPSPDHLPGRRL